MLYVLFRSLQLFSLIILISGLYIGIRDRNLILEIQALSSGALLFYLANWANEKFGKK